ncbi:MAG TPA: glucuronate isomerase [Verrucomicrobiae bacterium]|nr:glucuronate isomerase [Verrucomicrobiae bacterium]
MKRKPVTGASAPARSGSASRAQTFLTEDFLLHNDVARELYHEHARHEPIYDYHCHIPPDQVAANKQFRNLYEVWLAGDHYKWRAMRSNGVPEKYCTGDASDWEKFLAYARTVPYTLRNPLYHWTHLELKMYFGITKLLDESTAKEIWDEANEKLQSLPVHEILRRSKVALICTTDDPTDNLEQHEKIRASRKCPARVYPAYRPDKALNIDQPVAFNTWVDKLAAASGVECSSLQNLLAALSKRLDFFHENGSRLADHGLCTCYPVDCTQAEAARIFAEARARRQVSREEADKFRGFLLLWHGEQYHARGWVMQFHLGALRNNNTRLMRTLGPDTGFDSIGDWPQTEMLSRYLDKLDQANRLTKTILYCLNPSDNYAFATMLGNFQDGSVPGKIQFGSGWWFLDQIEGMKWQINALSNLGLLSRFVGMLTDSRSFLSYSRHEYFRRLLCNMIGTDVVNGEMPQDMKLLSTMVRNVCFHNAKSYFPMEPASL